MGEVEVDRVDMNNINENMYEGRNISIILNNRKMESYLIREFELTEGINEHQKLKLKIEVENDKKNDLEEMIGKEETEIRIEVSGEDISIGGKEIFKGIINYFEMLEYGSEGYSVFMEAFSYSILFDRKIEKKYRVFQDKNFTYANIIDEINKTYSNKDTQIKYFKEADVPIGKLVLQYNETDWEFLVRMASHLKTGLLVTEQGIITFGIIESGNVKSENKFYSDYSIVRDYKNLYYKVYSNKVVSLGDSVSINREYISDEKNKNENDVLTVLKTKIYLKNNLVKSEFLATDMKNYHILKKYNAEIKGCGIEAKVERVFSEDDVAKMEVLFYDGLNKIIEQKGEVEFSRAYSDYGIKRYPLSYQTFYSQTNTGFFCTPEVNDTVEVYFPNEDERFAKVSWAINNKGNGRFSDYTKRNFQINQSDFNFSLNLNSFEVKTAEKYSVESPNIVENADNFVNKANQNMIVASNNYLGIESIGDADFYGSKINIIGKEKEITMESLSSDVRIKGKKVHSN